MALCEAAAYYSSQGLTLCDQMRNLFEKYGYYKEGLCTVTLKGQDGAKRIAEMMEQIRAEVPETVGGFRVVQFRDYRAGMQRDCASGKESPAGLPASNVLYFALEDEAWCCVRPSGTEPKIKFYIGVRGKDDADASAKLEALTAAVQKLAE